VYGAPDWLVAFNVVVAGAVIVGGLLGPFQLAYIAELEVFT
jgi:hypothetical protein